MKRILYLLSIVILLRLVRFMNILCQGRCVAFEGHEGAYNIYENEIRLNVVIQKLDDVIQKLDQIQDNQYICCIVQSKNVIKNYKIITSYI